ncbi:MAG: homogentisate 1,2-dioxygenase [Myxococcota bacterium]
MLERIVAGDVPKKHHIQLRNEDGGLLHEECVTRRGFDGPYTITYHQYRPHLHRPVELNHGFGDVVAAAEVPLQKCHLHSLRERPEGAAIDVKMPLMFNQDVCVSVVCPTQNDPVYYVNADEDELYFIFEGRGTLRTSLGDVAFEQEDYVFVPRGIAHRFLLEPSLPQYWLSLTCAEGFGLLPKWRNDVGQLRMDAPYTHRDFRKPAFEGPIDEGIREILIKRAGRFHGFALPHPPLDNVGWDGSVYPWAFPILCFQPRVGQVHLPPDWHGTFRCRNALICSFVPRPVDFHPEAIPCPYPHSSVDCDEVLFYARGNFTSRRGVGPGSITHHPMGLPHGPHPGAYEESIGTKQTDELAVMMDTFAPLSLTDRASRLLDSGYMQSFFD